MFKYFVMLFAALFTLSASAEESKKEVQCGTVTITNKDFPSGVKGGLVLRYLDKEQFNAVLVLPHKQEALLEVSSNPMLDNPLWKMIEKCAGGPTVFDSKGKRIK